MSKTAFVFPGQGSQTVGMGKDLFESFPQVRELYEKANDLLGVSLSEICFEGPEDALKQTRNTQPALFLHSAAVALLLKEKGVDASGAAGHSLGEFSALCYAGALSIETGLKLVVRRGQLMQDAAEKNPGSMAAIIGLEPDDVVKMCEDASASGVVQPANFNSPGQIVISGSASGVEKACELAKSLGAKRALPLPVSGAFHSPLMQSASDLFADVLKSTEIKNTDLPVFANVTAAAVDDAATIKDLLAKQLTHSVRWTESIENMIKDGYTRFIEVGNGKVLCGLIRRISREVECINCGTVGDLDKF